MQMAPEEANIRPWEALYGSNWFPKCPNMPYKHSQIVRGHFRKDPISTILGRARWDWYVELLDSAKGYRGFEGLAVLISDWLIAKEEAVCDVLNCEEAFLVVVTSVTGDTWLVGSTARRSVECYAKQPYTHDL